MKIGLLAYPGCIASGLFAFYELLQMANKRHGHRVFELSWCGLSPGAMDIGPREMCARIEVETLLTDPKLEGVLVPGFWSDSERGFVRDMVAHGQLIKALAKNPAQGNVWGYCTGVGLLAEAGLLDGRDATTTWWLADHCVQTYPKVTWNFSQSYIESSKTITASGVSGYLPIAKSLIIGLMGERVWHDIGDVMVLPAPKPTFHPIQSLKLMKLESALLRRLFLWVERTPSSQLSLTDAAAELTLSTRTLSRKVRALSGLSCAELMRRIKLSQAADMLTYTGDQVAVISDRLGFSDHAAFRRGFKRLTGVTPGEYRKGRAAR